MDYGATITLFWKLITTGVDYSVDGAMIYLRLPTASTSRNHQLRFTIVRRELWIGCCVVMGEWSP